MSPRSCRPRSHHGWHTRRSATYTPFWNPAGSLPIGRALADAVQAGPLARQSYGRASTSTGIARTSSRDDTTDGPRRQVSRHLLCRQLCRAVTKRCGEDVRLAVPETSGGQSEDQGSCFVRPVLGPLSLAADFRLAALLIAHRLAPIDPASR